MATLGSRRRDTQKSGIHLAYQWRIAVALPSGVVQVTVSGLSSVPLGKVQKTLRVRKANYGASDLSVACKTGGRGRVYPGLDTGDSLHSGKSHRCRWELAHA